MRHVITQCIIFLSRVSSNMPFETAAEQRVIQAHILCLKSNFLKQSLYYYYLFRRMCGSRNTCIRRLCSRCVPFFRFDFEPIYRCRDVLEYNSLEQSRTITIEKFVASGRSKFTYIHPNRKTV